MFWKHNQAMTGGGLDQYAATVENILSGIVQDPAQTRLAMDEGYGWSFQHGSAIIEIYITRQQERGYLQVLSPIMHLPNSGLMPIYRRLLELNLSLTDAALGVYQDVVYIFSERPLEGLDASEATFIITHVAQYADEMDNNLVAEFGGRLYSEAR